MPILARTVDTMSIIVNDEVLCVIKILVNN